MYTGGNRPMTAKENQASDQSSEVVGVFKEASKNFIIIFLFHMAA
jgi:hypothetical protein